MKTLGVDIGGTNTDIVFYNGKFKHVATYPTPEFLRRFDEILSDLSDRYNAEGIGIGLAAWIKKGKIIKTPNIPMKIELSSDLNLRIDNDANCFALYCSKHFGFKDLIGITVGTGVGSGIVANGKLIRGCGLAGEIGHWYVGGERECTCGGRGHLEAYFGGWSMKKFEKMDPKDAVSGGKVYKIKGFELLCISVANAVMLLDPEAVVFGGRIGGNLDRDILKRSIYRYIMEGFEPKILTLNDPLAVAKGACYLFEEE